MEDFDTVALAALLLGYLVWRAPGRCRRGREARLLSPEAVIL